MFNRENLNGTIITSAVAILLAAIVLLANVPAILAALLGPGPGSDDPYQSIASLLNDHETEMETYRARFEGRSIFFPPPPPRVEAPPPPPPQPREQKEEPKDEPRQPAGPPPPPASYGGPAIAGAAGNEIWFKPRSANEPGMRLGIGEESNGVKVLDIDAPRTVRLAWQRGEYDVPIFPDWRPVSLNSDMPGNGRLGGLVVAPQTQIEAERQRRAEESATLPGTIPESRFDREREMTERSGREPPVDDPQEPEPDEPDPDEPEPEEPQADDPREPEPDDPQEPDDPDEPNGQDDPQSDEPRDPDEPQEPDDPNGRSDEPSSADEPEKPEPTPEASAANDPDK